MQVRGWCRIRVASSATRRSPSVIAGCHSPRACSTTCLESECVLTASFCLSVGNCGFVKEPRRTAVLEVRLRWRRRWKRKLWRTRRRWLRQHSVYVHCGSDGGGWWVSAVIGACCEQWCLFGRVLCGCSITSGIAFIYVGWRLRVGFRLAGDRSSPVLILDTLLAS